MFLYALKNSLCFHGEIFRLYAHLKSMFYNLISLLLCNWEHRSTSRY